MKRQSLFWGSVLILLAILFLLKAMGVNLFGKEVDVWGYFWAFGLMLVGIWFIVSVFIPRGKFDEMSGAKVSLGDAKEAQVEFHHGAGQVVIGSGAPADMLMVSNKGAGMSISSKTVGEQIITNVDLGPTFIPFIGPDSGAWNFQLNSDIPMKMEVEAGASQVTLNLTELKVTHLKLETGASNVKINLPANVSSTIVDIEAGAASVDIVVPEGVAARVKIKEGITSMNIDKNRFPWVDNTLYQSKDYDQATKRLDLTIEAGVGSINIH